MPTKNKYWKRWNIFVISMTYLNVKGTMRGHQEQEEKYMTKWREINDLLLYKNIPDSKSKDYDLCITPVILYAAEGWALIKTI